MNKRGFSMIEILIVIAVIAVLAVVVVLTLNPVEQLRQSRDARRIDDMKALTGAIDFFRGNNGGSTGTAGVIYVSLPDSFATSTAGDQCQALGLPAVTPGFTYHCASASTYRKTDGTGWVPVNFQGLAAGDILSGSLPIDPVNTSSSRDYYTYTEQNGQWEFTSPMESSKFSLGGSNDKVSTDGGNLMTLYQVGTNLSIEPLDYGDPLLVAYWTFDEGSGTVADDFSGNNATGSFAGGTDWTPAEIGQGAIFTASTLSEIDMPELILGGGAYSFCFWAYPSAQSLDTGSFVGASYPIELLFENTGPTNLKFAFSDEPGSTPVVETGNVVVPQQWAYFCATRSTSNIVNLYINGVLQSDPNVSGGDPTQMAGTQYFLLGEQGDEEYYDGILDDYRIYNKELSAAQVQALYNAAASL